MIVNLTVRPHQGEARAFEFRRDTISVGAGSRNDLVVESSNEVIRILSIQASNSGVRVTALSEQEAVCVALPEDRETRAPDSELLLPIGSKIFIGAPPIEIRIDNLRRPDGVE